MVNDITKRVHNERRISLLNRLYRVLSHVSRAVVRAQSPEIFLKEVCRIIVEEGDFLGGWIGYVDHNTHAVKLVSSCGKAGEYANGITVYADDRPEGRGPTGTCIRKRRPALYNDLLNDPGTVPWQARAAQYGVASAAAFPIESAGQVWGALTIYSGQVNFFTHEDFALLEDVAADIGFALDNLERERLRRQAEETLRLSEDRYRRLFEDAVLGIFRSTVDGKIIEVNPAFARMFGFDSPDEAKNQVKDVACDLYVNPPRRSDIIGKMLKERESIRLENLYKRKDGTTFTGNLYLWAVRAADGTDLHLEGFVEDISERKRAEEEKERLESQLRQAQKLEAIGTLASGIAHDFNNILAPIIGYAEMTMNELPQTNPLRFGQEQILKAALRARDLVRQILAFSRLGRGEELKQVEISSIVKEALKLLRASLPSSIEIVQSIDSCLASADPTEIHQILMNLCTNAAHAMDNKGVLEVSLSRVHLNITDLTDQSLFDLEPGPHLKLSVSDTGIGMEAATLERIFDPFFTTKEVGKGSGLGLSVVRGIAKRHHGAITVRSAPGKGATFDLHIPAIDTTELENIEAEKSLLGGTERILIIDDEQSVLEMTVAILRGLGYGITAEMESPRACKVFSESPDKFDLVLTDYTMPKLTGLDLAALMRKVRPDIPIILCTGFSDKISKKALDELGLELLTKPYSLMQLSETIRNVLDKQKVS
jgi:PAS domain S-box-containing protein